MPNDQRPQVLLSGQNKIFMLLFLGIANKKSAHKHGHFGSIIPKTHRLQNQYTSEGKFQNLHQAAYILNRFQIDKG